MVSEDVSDRRLLNHLRRVGGASVGDLTDLLGVTATAVRQRLNRLMKAGLVDREQNGANGDRPAGRGRPGYTYRLTDLGRRDSGDNYNDLAQAMWEEIRSIEDPTLKSRLVKSLATKLAERYADRAAEISGDAGGECDSSTADGHAADSRGTVQSQVVERMERLVEVMSEREVPVEVREENGLPVLTMLACPYPALAEQDRTVCDLEKLMISEVLGQDVRLSGDRLGGGTCCTFQPSQQPSQAVASETV